MIYHDKDCDGKSLFSELDKSHIISNYFCPKYHDKEKSDLIDTINLLKWTELEEELKQLGKLMGFRGLGESWGEMR